MIRPASVPHTKILATLDAMREFSSHAARYGMSANAACVLGHIVVRPNLTRKTLIQQTELSDVKVDVIVRGLVGNKYITAALDSENALIYEATLSGHEMINQLFAPKPTTDVQFDRPPAA